MEIYIREATLADLDLILKLNKALFDHETMFNSEYNLDWTYSPGANDYFKQTIEGEKGIALVAVVEDKVIGYIALSIYSQSFLKQNPIAELDNMFVNDAYRGKGVGKKLVEEAKRQAKGKGAKKLKVEAAVQNEKAINLYRSCGFSDFDLILMQDL
jgi:ribosomal protein S18 acetylase RimI-like enzyme